jgi:hypothetical protein
MRPDPRGARIHTIFLFWILATTACAKPDEPSEPSERPKAVATSTGVLVPIPPRTTTPRAPAPSFDDVPELLGAEGRTELPVLFSGAPELPAETVLVSRVSRTYLGAAPPGIGRAALAADVLGGGPALSQRWAASPVGGAEILADVLLNAGELRSWLTFGRELAIASRYTRYQVTLQVGPRSRDVVSLISTERALAPQHYLTPAHAPAGLTGLRCARLDDGSCEPRSPAVARIDRLSMLAIGDFRALVQLASPPVRPWAGAELSTRWPLGTAGMGHCDIELAAPWTSLGPIEITVPPDQEVYAAYQTLKDAVDTDGAIRASAIASSWVGELHMVFRASSPAKAVELRGKVERYRAALGRRREGKLVSSDDSDGYARTISRAIVQARVTTLGRDVRIDSTVSEDAVEHAWLDERRRARSERYTALARVLTSVIEGEAIEDEDARALGGDALIEALKSRRSRVPRDDVETSPLRGFEGVRVPVGEQSAGQTFPGTVVRWSDGGGERVDALLDVLRRDGFSIDTAQPTPVGAWFVAHRGSSGLSIGIRRSGIGVEARFSALQ